MNNNSFPLTESGRENSIIGYFLSVGLKGFEGGIWVGIGTTGDYRSSTSSKEGMVNALHFIESIVNHIGNNYRAAGIMVRCVSEKSDHNISDDDDDKIYLEIVAENVVDAAYKKKNGNNGSVNYYNICLSNTKTEIDDQGQIVPIGKGEIICFDLYASTSEDSENAIIPQGTYTLGSSTNEGISTTDYTFIHYR